VRPEKHQESIHRDNPVPVNATGKAGSFKNLRVYPKKSGKRKRREGSSAHLRRIVLFHLLPHFIDMHDHIEGRAGQAVALLVERIDRELRKILRDRLGGKFPEVEQVADVQADLVADLLQFPDPAF